MFCTIRNYSNFDLSSLSAGSIELIIWGICAGILIGVVCSIIQKHTTSALIHALIEGGISEESKAKTLDELKIKGKWYLNSTLNAPHKFMRRYVVCANEGELIGTASSSKENYGKIPMEKARFYLPEENRIKAEIRFARVKKPVFSILLTAILVIAAAAFAIYIAPELLQMLDNFITSVKS